MLTNATALTIPAINVEIDLSQVERFGNGRDGRLIAIGYAHEPYYPSQSGPVLHFQLPDGRVVQTVPNADGYELCWKDSSQRAEVDAEVAEVVHLMWDQIDTIFQSVLARAFGNAAMTALAKVISST